jgi:2-C-methyl-D-erythritol 4-phosphate cytidylyltransferase
MKKKLIAIVPSAGLGKRFDPSRKKTFVSVHGIPLLVYTLKRLHGEKAVTEIIPALRQDDREQGHAMVREYSLNKIKRFAPGGQERQDSIYNALKLIEEEGTDAYKNYDVLIHDGVRPYFPEDMIEQLSGAIQDVDGVIPGIPLIDTIKETDAAGIVVSTLDREKVRAVQTPQFFPFRVIKKAYDKAYQDGFYATDDAALVERIGGRIRIIAGSPLNIKVTVPEDLEVIAHMLKKERQSL